MKDENLEESKNSFIKTSLLVILGFCIVIIVARYITDENFRSEIDTNIFGKQVAESSLNSIEINTDTNPAIFAYDKYITILSKNKLTSYNSKGTLASELDVSISVPLSHSEGKYMVFIYGDNCHFCEMLKPKILEYARYSLKRKDAIKIYGLILLLSV